MSKINFYSSHHHPELIRKATLKLLEDNSLELLQYIYEEDKHDKDIFGHPEVRVGLSLKILNNLRTSIDVSLIKPIIKDIEFLIDSQLYLESTGNPEKRKKCLEEELQFVQRYLDIEDTLTLNTEIPRAQRVAGQSQKVNEVQLDKYYDENTCSIM